MNELHDIAGAVDRAAAAISNADALLITAGAGMGVDSVLPDFRGGEGFWHAYLPLARRGISFEEMADPEWFFRDPQLAWRFYGHQLNLYRQTEPHAGFDILRRWAERTAHGAIVFTSNVDGPFQKAGFANDRISECHGSIHHLQCCLLCGPSIWSADTVLIIVDESELRAAPPLPACPGRGVVARPNVLMFGDMTWHRQRAAAQDERMIAWLEAAPGAEARLVVVECGVGYAIPTVRRLTERIFAVASAPAIRINPRDPHISRDMISIPPGALDALRRVDDLV